MFNRNRKNDSTKHEEVDNVFGDKGYQMKNTYKADNLVVANFQRVSSTPTNFEGPMVETTNQKYIFETFVDEKKTKYREIFTGFIADDEEQCFDLPYVVDPKPIAYYLPEIAGVEIPKLSLIWAQNDINYLKQNNDSKQLKKLKISNNSKN